MRLSQGLGAPAKMATFFRGNLFHEVCSGFFEVVCVRVSWLVWLVGGLPKLAQGILPRYLAATSTVELSGGYARGPLLLLLAAAVRFVGLHALP